MCIYSFFFFFSSFSFLNSYTQIAKYWKGLKKELMEPVNQDLASSLKAFKMNVVIPPCPEVMVSPAGLPIAPPEGSITFPAQSAVEQFQMASAVTDQETRSAQIIDVEKTFSKKRKGVYDV
jgi:hypothetical protein